MQGKAGLDRRAGQSLSQRQDEAGLACKAGRSRACVQGRTWQGRTGQDRAGLQCKAGQGTSARQGRAEHACEAGKGKA